MEFLFQKYEISQGNILDSFAGSGTALFAARDLGLDGDGIELLPIGQTIIETIIILTSEFTSDDIARLKDWVKLPLWKKF